MCDLRCGLPKNLRKGKHVERAIVKSIVTKKIAVQYKYVVNFYISIYFIEAMIGFMAWLLNFSTFSHIPSCFLCP